MESGCMMSPDYKMTDHQQSDEHSLGPSGHEHFGMPTRAQKAASAYPNQPQSTQDSTLVSVRFRLVLCR
jgi:hypothetical protein